MSTVTCRNCGAVCLATHVYCPRCGSSLNSQSPQPDAVQVSGLTSKQGERDYGVQPAQNSLIDQGTPSSGAWRQGDVLVVHKSGHHLPDRCIRCNAPAPGPRVNKRLYWHHPALYLLVFTGFVPYLIVSLILRKEATLSVALCQEHRSPKIGRIIVGWLVLALGLASLIAALLQSLGYLGPLARYCSCSPSRSLLAQTLC